MKRTRKRTAGIRTNRRLRVESLECRRVLASFVVTTNLDIVDATDGLISLREAATAANRTAGADEITFDPVAFGNASKIELTLGAIGLSEGVEIRGPGRDLLSIDGQSFSRVFVVSPINAIRSFTISDLTITGGRTTGPADKGGAIFQSVPSELTFENVAIANSRTLGNDSDGGAIFATGTLIVRDSMLVGNETLGAGSDGGAIAGLGSITIINSELIGNVTSGVGSFGGAIRSSESLSIQDSLVSQNRTTGRGSDGGAIHAVNRIDIQATRVNGNETRGDDADGGAISVSQAVETSGGGYTFIDTDIDNNATRGSDAKGGGIFADDSDGLISRSSLTNNVTEGVASHGGAIFAMQNRLNIEQSTVSGNRVTGAQTFGGGIDVKTGSLSVSGVTIADNSSVTGGGGIYFDSSVAASSLNIDNSIIATNRVTAGTPTAAPDVGFFQAQPTLQVRSSLIGSNTGSTLIESQTPDANGNLIGGFSAGSLIDPRLADLTLSGNSRLHPLLDDSPAIDRGDNSLSTDTLFDQRGSLFDRVSNSRIDMGAFELQGVAPKRFVVSTLIDELDFSNQTVSLREAITTANQNPGADIITFRSSLLSGNNVILLSLGQLLITDSVSIVGPGRDSLIVDGQGLSRLFEVIGEADVVIAELTLSGGRVVGANELVLGLDSLPVTTQFGGAIRSETAGSLTLRRVTVAGNEVSGAFASGGGVWAEMGSLVIEDSVVQSNVGGGLAVRDNSLGLIRSSIVTNADTGVSVDQSVATIVNTTISGNTGTNGGGIRASRQSDVSLVQATVVGNSAERGGGVFITDDNGEIFRIANSIIAGNQATVSNPELSLPSQLDDFAINFSLLGDNSGTVLAESQTAGTDGNLIGSAGGMGVIDPLLGPLTTLAGLVPFHEPNSSSPVIDAGSDSLALDGAGLLLVSDARGLPFARQSGTVDMGAIELQDAPIEGDRGDAPESYSTRLENDGPRHAQSTLTLGSLIDFEINGNPSPLADGDGTDEDGVQFATSIIAGATATTASLLVTASASSRLDAWIDFDRNGVFDAATERIGGATSLDLVAGVNVVPFTVPAGAVAGPTFARFRLSSAGGLLPTGPASDGEVEDYAVTLLSGNESSDVSLFVTGSQIKLVRQGDELVVLRRSVEVFRAARASINRMTINADEFSSVLTIDQSGGDSIPTGGLVFDGVDRVNTVRWVGSDGNLNLTSSGNLTLRNVTAIDLTDAGAQSVVIDSASALQIDPDGGGIIITGSTNDRITFADGSLWRMRDPEVVFGQAFSVTAIIGTFVQTDFTSGWQNLAQPSDVNNSGVVTANDALVIINELGRRTYSNAVGGQLVNPASVDPWPGFYYDQNGDGLATALDALRVINQLARIANSGGSGEGEASRAIDVARKVESSDVDDVYSDDEFVGSLF